MPIVTAEASLPPPHLGFHASRNSKLFFCRNRGRSKCASDACLGSALSRAVTPASFSNEATEDPLPKHHWLCQSSPITIWQIDEKRKQVTVGG
ncbi:hypothetical protein CDEST_14719 [Colletotrichum destructivum]|uniref:Uncharacterized protein n=1 Tax=Colletotrichum destructivum TaxID=34406 RepID=A0AAX4J2Z9_9PEZI|nr:hypothetical protein CDEST_14719 [Colletotrichum destructivum]